VRIDSAFDTQQTRVVVTPEDTLQGWFVGVSLLTIRRARMEHFGGGLKIMELGRFWRDGLEGPSSYLVDVTAWVWPCKFVESRNVFTLQCIYSLAFLGRI
jgi:hypothetical protein